MKQSAPLLCLLLCGSILSAQNLAGNYLLKGSNGNLRLELENNIGGVQGYLKDPDGNTYFAQAEVENGIAFGTMNSDQGALFFRASRNGAILYLTLMPVAANGQPAASGHQEFTLVALDQRGNPIAQTPPPPVRPRDYEAPPDPVWEGRSLQPDKWNGFFSGRVMDVPSTLNLQLNGSQLNGDMDVSGYRYRLEGTTTGHQTRGRLFDLQTRTYLNFTANMDGKQINLNMENPINGTSQLVIFKRGEGTVLNPDPPYNARPDIELNRLAEERDTRLIGHWNYTERFAVDDFSYTNYWKFILNPDGTYVYGDATLIGSGQGAGGRGYGGDIMRGKWRTANNIIWINSGGGWEAYARYSTDGRTTVMQFGDGSQQSWYRSN